MSEILPPHHTVGPFPQALIEAKNRLHNPDAWLVLLQINLPDGPVYLVNNNENISFKGNEYIKSSFILDPPKRDNTSSIQNVTLRVSNVNLTLMPYLETYESNLGGIGLTVIVTVVESALLQEDYAETTMEFDVMATVVDEQWVNFSLGGPNPLLMRFPLHRYIAGRCKWVGGYLETPRWPECGYTGGLATCDGTLGDCRAHNNSRRFGGFPGLNSHGVYLD